MTWPTGAVSDYRTKCKGHAHLCNSGPASQHDGSRGIAVVKLTSRLRRSSTATEIQVDVAAEVPKASYDAVQFCHTLSLEVW